MSRRTAYVIAVMVVMGTLLVGAYVAKRLLTSGAAVQTTAQRQSATMLTLLNRQRSVHHLSPFKRDPVLDAVARAHDQDMLKRNYFAHDAPGGPTFAERFHRIKPHRTLGEENIAWGSGSYGTPAGLVSAWMASPGHRANILNPRARRIGLDVASGRYQGQPVATVSTNDFSN